MHNAMTKTDYVARITNATPLQLVIITYEMMLEHIRKTKQALEAQSNVNKPDAYRPDIKFAQDFLAELMRALDMQYSISKDLMSIYIYVNGLLCRAYFSKTLPALEESEKILNTLLSGWQAIESEEDPAAASVIDNAQQLYAGLTYRNGQLDEVVMEQENRGFRA